MSALTADLKARDLYDLRVIGKGKDSVIYEARCPKLAVALGYGSAYSTYPGSSSSSSARRRSSSSSAASSASVVDADGRTLVGPGARKSSSSSTGDDSSLNEDPLLGGPLVAVKVYERAKLSPSKLRAVRRETAMMIYASRKKVPSTVRFLAAFDDEGKVHIVMEACGGGDLLERLLHEGRAFCEARAAAEVAAPLLSCLASLHALSIVHRDVKLENVFVGDDGGVRLGDFGLTLSLKQELAISPVGTVEYMAPEIVALPPVDAVTSGAVLPSSIAACDEKVDVWALGVTLYELLTGHLPFEGADKAAVKASIAAHKLRPFPRSLSADAVDFVSAMLAPEAADRPSAAALLRHPFVLKNTGPGAPSYGQARFPAVCRSHDGCAQCLARAAGAARERALAEIAAAAAAAAAAASQQQQRVSLRRRSRETVVVVERQQQQTKARASSSSSGGDTSSMMSASSVREVTSSGTATRSTCSMSSPSSPSRDERQRRRSSAMMSRSTSSSGGAANGMNAIPEVAADPPSIPTSSLHGAASPFQGNERNSPAPLRRSSWSADSVESTGSGILDVLEEVDAPPPPSVVIPPWRGNTHRRAATDASSSRGNLIGDSGPVAAVGGGVLSPAPSAPLLAGNEAGLSSSAASMRGSAAGGGFSASAAALSAWAAGDAPANAPAAAAPYSRFVDEKRSWPAAAAKAAKATAAPLVKEPASAAASASKKEAMSRSASMPANIGKAAAAGALPSSTLLGGRRPRGASGTGGGARGGGAVEGGDVEGGAQWSRKLRTRLRSLLSLRSVTPTPTEQQQRAEAGQ